jgi:hypothetical protein
MNRYYPQETAEDVADTAFGQARQYGEKAQDAARQIRPIVERALREQPMATLAGAIVIGFVLGISWQQWRRMF